jgi:hypothetical protein
MASRPHWAEQLARILDDGFRVPGTELRFGLDPIIGLLAPGVGDVVAGLCNIALIVLAVREGVPLPIVVRMLVNVLIDVLVGTVPIAGDAFDFVWKATRKNLDLIDAHRSGKPPGVADYVLLVAVIGVILGAPVLPVMVVIAIAVWLAHR